jgi:hypothetical protein
VRHDRLDDVSVAHHCIHCLANFITDSRQRAPTGAAIAAKEVRCFAITFSFLIIVFGTLMLSRRLTLGAPVALLLLSN